MESTQRTAPARITINYGTAPVREKGEKPTCPVCEDAIRGTVDVIDGTAFTCADGSEYFGETDVDWNSQRNITADIDGEIVPLLQCETGHLFFHAGVNPNG